MFITNIENDDRFIQEPLPLPSTAPKKKQKELKNNYAGQGETREEPNNGVGHLPIPPDCAGRSNYNA